MSTSPAEAWRIACAVPIEERLNPAAWDLLDDDQWLAGYLDVGPCGPDLCEDPIGWQHFRAFRTPGLPADAAQIFEEWARGMFYGHLTDEDPTRHGWRPRVTGPGWFALGAFDRCPDLGVAVELSAP